MVYRLQVCPANSNIRVHRICSGNMKVGKEYDSLTGTLDYSVLLCSLRWSQYQFCIPVEDVMHLYSNYLMQDTSYYCEFHALVKFYRDRNKIAVLKAYQENRQSDGDFKFEIDTIPLTIYGCNIIRF